MALDRPLDEITESDLMELIENEVSEGKSIDYKLELPGKSDGDRKEFLADVSSFSNTNGGHIVFGIREQGGIPTELVGLECENWDELVRAYENLIRDAIEPRIMDVNLRAVPLSSRRAALIIRIPKSWIQPHMVILKGTNKFYARNSAGKYPLDVTELRHLFSYSSGLADRIRSFRRERLAALLSREGPITMSGQALVVLHIVPFSFENPERQINLRPIIESTPPQPFNVAGWDHRFNLDGFLTFSELEAGRGLSTCLQIFRNGIIEAIDGITLSQKNGEKKIPVHFEDLLVMFAAKYLSVQEKGGIAPPLALMVSLTFVKDFIITPRQRFYDAGEPSPIDRDHLLFPEVIIDNYRKEAAAILKPILDALWNASGFRRCMLYDSEGHWTLKE